MVRKNMMLAAKFVLVCDFSGEQFNGITLKRCLDSLHNPKPISKSSQRKLPHSTIAGCKQCEAPHIDDIGESDLNKSRKSHCSVCLAFSIVISSWIFSPKSATLLGEGYRGVSLTVVAIVPILGKMKKNEVGKKRVRLVADINGSRSEST